MKNLLTALSIALATTVSASAVAQTRFCIGGDLDHLSMSDRASCAATMQAVRASATAMHAPDDWHFVVVCGEEGWKQYAAFSPRDPEVIQDAAADTDLDQHVTYLREERLHAPQAHSLQRVVAHEVASILLKTNDEDAIQTKMASWERSSQVEEASLAR